MKNLYSSFLWTTIKLKPALKASQYSVRKTLLSHEFLIGKPCLTTWSNPWLTRWCVKQELADAGATWSCVAVELETVSGHGGLGQFVACFDSINTWSQWWCVVHLNHHFGLFQTGLKNNGTDNYSQLLADWAKLVGLFQPAAPSAIRSANWLSLFMMLIKQVTRQKLNKNRRPVSLILLGPVDAKRYHYRWYWLLYKTDIVSCNPDLFSSLSRW